MLKQNNKQTQKGFTLIELLVVIAIIALLSSIALVGFANAREKGRNTKRVSDMAQLQKAMDLYYSSNNTYPTVSAGLALGSWDQTILVPKYITDVPNTVLPADPGCSAGPGPSTNDYYMQPNVVGSQYATSVFAITFCISTQVGTLAPGPHTVTNLGFK